MNARVADNLALNKRASQISTESAASNAVDGDVKTWSCTNNVYGQPWWAVDLDLRQGYYIGRVTITFPNVNRNGECNYRRFCFIHEL